MVVVVVADAHYVQIEPSRSERLRHLFYSEWHSTKTFRPEPLRRGGALTEDWIAQHTDAVDVNENTRVTNPYEGQRTLEEAVPVWVLHR